MRAEISLTFAVVLIVCIVPHGLRGEGGPPADLALDQAEQLMKDRKFDEALQLLDVTAQSHEDRTVAAWAQYRLGEYLGYIKEYAKDKQHWHSVVEGHLRQAITDYPDEREVVSLSRIKLSEALLGQGRIGEARDVAQELLDASPDSPRFQGWARLKRVESSLAAVAGKEGAEIRAAHLSAVDEMNVVVTLCDGPCPEVANWARVRQLSSLVAAWEFMPVQAVCDAVISDHARARASDKQAAWALVLEGAAFNRQKRWDDAARALEMAVAVADPNHLDLKYRAEGDLRRVYKEIVDEEFGVGEAAFVQEDLATARAWFESAYERTFIAGGYRAELVRERLAQVAQRSGDIDRAIAYWRQMIDDPAKPEGKGIEATNIIAELLHNSGPPEAEEQWRQYLLNPTTGEDPTAPLVAAAFGAAPSSPQGAVQDVSGRRATLGKLYLRQKRFDEALSTFEQAEQTATNPKQRADALTGRVYAQAGQARLMGGAPQEAEQAQQLRAEAISLANEAAVTWQAIALSSGIGSSHYAIEQAVEMFKATGQYEEGLAMADGIIDALNQTGAPAGKLAFAEYERILALCWNKRFSEAIQSAHQLDQTYAAQDADVFHLIRSFALLVAAGAHAQSGNPPQGRVLIGTVEGRDVVGVEVMESAAKFRHMMDLYEVEQ